MATEFEAALMVLGPLAQHDFVSPYVHSDWINFPGLMESDWYPMMSTGEQAVIKIAHQIWSGTGTVAMLRAMDEQSRARAFTALMRRFTISEQVHG